VDVGVSEPFSHKFTPPHSPDEKSPAEDDVKKPADDEIRKPALEDEIPASELRSRKPRAAEAECEKTSSDVSKEKVGAAWDLGGRISSQTVQEWNKELGDVPIIRTAAEYFKVTPVQVAMALGLALVGFMLYGIGGGLLSTVVGVAYPAYESFKALESFANMAEPESLYTKASDMQFWLTYWIVFSAYATFEHMVYYIVVWFPFYYPMKVCFFLWLFLPQTRGANTLYHWLVSPILKRNQRRIDSALEESARQLKESSGKVRKSIGGKLSHAASRTGDGLLTAASTGLAHSKTALIAASAAAQATAASLRRSKTSPDVVG
jgi:receptor expression-enhancing protein 5/6